MEIEAIDEIFSITEEGALGEASIIADETTYLLSKEGAEKEALDVFSSDVMEDSSAITPPRAPNKLIKWLSEVEGKTWMSFGFNVAMVGIMLYPIIASSLKKAQDSGQRISLNSAIAGAKNTLVTNYDTTIRAPAQKVKDDATQWANLPKTVRDEIEATLAVTGQIYWIEQGPGVMDAMAKMPIYDPTAA